MFLFKKYTFIVVSGFAFSFCTNASKSSAPDKFMPEYFTEYLSQTALDMVKKLPGFVFVETDGGVRGFTSGSGNVLINGIRPTTKSGGVSEALSRIPTDQVLYIELIKGATGTSDSAGQNVVANVIKKKQAAKRWQLTTEILDDGNISPIGNYTIASQINDWSTTLNLIGKDQDFFREADIATFTSDRQLTKQQFEERPATLREVFISGEASRQINNHKLAINSRIGWSQYKSAPTRNTVDSPNFTHGFDALFESDKDSQYYAGELGIDWRIKLENGWNWRLLNLNNNQNWFVDSISETSSGGEFNAGSVLRFDEHQREHIIRMTMGRTPQENRYLSFIEYGAEYTKSSLTSKLKTGRFEDPINSGTFSNTSFSKVTENRVELFANYSWKLGSFKLDTNLAAEHSTISVSGDQKNTQSLTFFKPSVLLTRDIDNSSQLRVNLKREIGQLDFSDFAASADLENDRESSANAELKPETKVVASIEYDYRFNEKGAVSLKLFHEWRSYVLEQIIISSDRYAFGNAGNAQVYGVGLNLNMPLNQWIDNSLLSLYANYRWSSFDDDITQNNRGLTGIISPDVSVDFRKDIVDSKISWGFGYDMYMESESFYVTEYSRLRTKGSWDAFIETVTESNYKIKASAQYLGYSGQEWYRTFYPDTRAGKLSSFEEAHRNNGPVFNITISRAF